jgi:hypothetical protein
MPGHKPVDMTEAQLAALTMLTEQRGLNLLQLSDIIGDMTPMGLEFLRRLGDPSHAELTRFLTQAHPETFDLLADLREDEVETLKSGIKIVVAIKIVGTLMKWGLGGLIAAFITMATVGKEVSAWLKLR